MNQRECLIIDLERIGDKRMFITDQVESISRNSNGMWTVRFVSSPRVFNYNASRLLRLANPEVIDLKEKGMYVNNKHITDVRELLKFTDGSHTYYFVTYNNGYTETLDGENVYVTRTRLDATGGSLWQYLKALADETGLLLEGINILSKQYDIVDVYRDNVPLAQFLGNKEELGRTSLPHQILYPYGCNASQKKAVENALSNQVSIIQGPPGTGKTQTILNIICNLILKSKSVLVVSNNNSAVDNVAEKLEADGLGFLVAKLGSRENKEAFIANQKEIPYLGEWRVNSESALRQRVAESLKKATKGFDYQEEKARLKVEYDALLTESKYNELANADAEDYNWLWRKSSKDIIKLLSAMRVMQMQGRKPSLMFKLRWSWKMGMRLFFIFKEDTSDISEILETAYYHARKNEIESRFEEIDAYLQQEDIPEAVKTLRSGSMQLVKNRIAKKYTDYRKRFTIKDLKPRSEEFLKEYPIVLSTTYSARTCISKDLVFDYVIMDEASQVDVKTGALALACACNAVIVGDDKQLPNVVTKEEKIALEAIQEAFKVPEQYKASENSFLESCCKVFGYVPVTLLREHYRCHPKIIDFCNKLFYNGELIAMTTDKGEENVLRAIRTAPGNHARGCFNQREIDVIKEEVMPLYREEKSVGIITPFNDQAKAINETLGADIASTVHKYQGRECDSIIISSVTNSLTEFSDDPNLINVAISRAKTHLCLVTTGNDMPNDSNIGQLISYIKYNNFEIRDSKVFSVFDLLYKQCTNERLAYEANNPQASEYLSENLIYNLLNDILEANQCRNIGILLHYPLKRLVKDWTLLDPEQQNYAKNALTHVDILMYNSLTKKPLAVIEVDGWKYHRENEVQAARDALKDEILEKYDLRPLRLRTTDTVNKQTLWNLIKDKL